MSLRRLFVYGTLLFLAATSVRGARYQRTQDGKTEVWNSLRGVAQEVTWSGLRDLNGYATGEGTLTWYRLGSVVNTYTGKMVKGKFEGPVIRVQGSTRLEATFANGEKTSGWLEPKGAASTTPSPNEQLLMPTAKAARPVTESSTPFPTPTPTPKPLATPPIEPTAIPTPKQTPTPKPTSTPTPTPQPTPTFTPSPTPIPIATPTSTPRPTATPTATPKPSLTPTPTPAAELQRTPTPVPKSTPVGMPILLPTPRSTPTAPVLGQPARKESPSGPTVEGPEGPVHSLKLAASPSPQVTLEEAPRNLPPPTAPPRISSSSPPTAGSRSVDPAVKRQMIADLKRQTEFVLGEAREATGNFREVDQLDQVKNLPPRVSAHVSLLANQARGLRTKLGYEVTYYECLAEIQAVDTLVVLDEVTGSVADKDAPAARTTLATFRSRYSEPTAEAQKPLWRYLISVFNLCDRLKNEAETHLPKALSLETSGKKSEALLELREVYRIYPNPVTAEKIRQLENQLRLTP